jgi:hypothetical protein
MNVTVFDLILRQSYLHLISYGLVTSILLVALADCLIVRQLRKALQLESARLQTGGLSRADLIEMIHPVGAGLGKVRDRLTAGSRERLRRQMELAEAVLFVPLKSRIVLTRDLSTLMGLIATLLALVAAASEFAKHGKPELLIGSVGTGCVATCVAAIGCAMALWNLSRLTRLRLRVASEIETVLFAMDEEPDLAEEGEVQHFQARRTQSLPAHRE